MKKLIGIAVLVTVVTAYCVFSTTQNVTVYRGWVIYRIPNGYQNGDLTTDLYRAVKGNAIIEGVDLPDLKADIDEYERG